MLTAVQGLRLACFLFCLKAACACAAAPERSSGCTFRIYELLGSLATSPGTASDPTSALAVKPARLPVKGEQREPQLKEPAHQSGKSPCFTAFTSSHGSALKKPSC